MKVPFIDFKRHYLKHQRALLAASERVLKSGQYVLGPEVEAFERLFTKHCKAGEVVGVANGLEALQIALRSAGVKSGDEVITTPLSAVATTLAIDAVGAKPIFVDTDEFFHIDATKVEKAITRRTKAILPVHLYGQAVAMDALMTIAKKNSLVVIEDAAQAVGTTYAGKPVGNFGLVSGFSFYPTKNLGAFGDAGAVVTKNKSVAAVARQLRDYGQQQKYLHVQRGYNSRLDELQAALLQVQLKQVSVETRQRQELAARYRQALRGVRQITLPKLRPKSNHTYHLFVIEADRRDDLQKFLAKHGIETGVHYPRPIYRQPCYADLKQKSLPMVERQCQRILSLPLYPFLTATEIDYVAAVIKKFYAKKSV